MTTMRGRRTRRRLFGRTALAGAVVVVAATATAGSRPAAAVSGPGPADRAPVAPVLLPGDNTATQGVDISPSGVVVGLSAAGPGTPGAGWHWLPTPGGGYVGRRLAVPDGTAGVEMTGVTDLGEAGGTLLSSAGRLAVRWTVSGARTVPLGPAGSSTTAVGPAQWGISNGDAITGTADLVSRDGTITHLAGTPDLANVRVVARSVSGPATALLWATGGVGYGFVIRPVVWRDGATAPLPVTASYAVSMCTSTIQPDGSVAYRGIIGVIDGTPVFTLGVHRGGVPGTNVALPTGGRTPTLTCSSDDWLAADGSAVGQLQATATQPAEAVLWRGTTLVPLGVRPGETATEAVAVATRGRVVIVATTADGTTRPYLWSNGARTPLALPAGWTLRSIVELTDAGTVLGNVTDAAGDIRPVVWAAPR